MAYMWQGALQHATNDPGQVPTPRACAEDLKAGRFNPNIKSGGPGIDVAPIQSAVRMSQGPLFITRVAWNLSPIKPASH